MNYYYDCEFLEGKQDKRFLGIKCGQTKPTIDLISIGIVAQDGREYYAISKDFNLKEAWNRYDLVWEQTSGDMRNRFPEGITKKVYWIRENVLKPIYYELLIIANKDWGRYPVKDNFSYSNLKSLINRYGKSNKQIAQDVFEFISGDTLTLEKAKHYNVSYKDIDLYGYYSAYDHVCFSWLFGKMIDLPSGFPMYTNDLKQELDKLNFLQAEMKRLGYTYISNIQMYDRYPKQENEHSAIHDARWNKKLHEFLKTIKIAIP